MRAARAEPMMAPVTANGHGPLTPHELQVARLVARGATNQEAADELSVSPKTVEAHLSRIYRKLELRSRTELALHMVRRGERQV